MKFKLQTMLKHKLQWLLLLAALLGVSQGVWGGTYAVHMTNGTGDNWIDNALTEQSTDYYTATITLSASKTYTFGIKWNDNWKTNGGAYSSESSGGWWHLNGTENTTMTTSVAGDYVFKVRYKNNQYEFAIDYPSDVISCDVDSWEEHPINGSYTYNFTSTGTREFVIKTSGGTYYKNVDFTRCDNSKTLTSANTSDATVDVDLAGNYTFTWNSSTHLLTISYPTDGCHPDCSDMINIVNGTNVMFYFLTYSDKGWNAGSVGITDGTKSLIGTSNRIGDTYYGYVTMPSGSVPSNVYVTNNGGGGGWEGRKCAEGQTSASAAGALYVGNTDPGSKTDATSITVTPSASSIPTGTSSITLTSRASSTNSSKSNPLKSIVYVCNSDKSVCNQAAGSCQNVSTSNYNYTLSTSSLAAGTYKIVTILTDGTVHYIGNEFTLTVSACSKPSVSFDSPVTSVCSGTTQSYTAIGTTSSGTISSYTWGVSGTGWSRSDSGTSASATFNTGTGTGTITVTATNSCGSESDAASQTVTIKGTPSAPSFSSGATKLCENVSENSYVITGTADAFIWENNGNGISWHSTPASSDKTVKVDVASSITDGANTYVRVKAQNCGSLNSDYATKNITLYKSAFAGTVALSKSAACVGESGLTASTSGTWYMGGGTGEWSSTATNYATINTDGNIIAKAAGSPYIKYTIKNPVCGSETSSQATLTISGPADFNITSEPASGYTPWKPITLSTSPSGTATWAVSTDPSLGKAYLSTLSGTSTVLKAPADVSSYTVSATKESGGCSLTRTKNITVTAPDCN